MNYTKNYQLPQWVETDRIQMQDFNQMCADIDAGLAAAQSTAEGAQSTAGAAQNTAQAAATAAATAQRAADTAQATADAAYSPSQKPYVVGSYTGTGSAKTIELGFRPSFVIVSGGTSDTTSGMEQYGYYAMTAGGAYSDILLITDTGFQARTYSVRYPQLSASGRAYDYIAFR